MASLTLPRTLFCALLGASVATVPRPASAQGTSTVRAATIAVDPGGELYYADDQGLFAQNGLRVEGTSMSNGGATIDAVLGGAIDVGFTSTFSVVIARARKVPIVIVAPAGQYLGRSTGEALFVRRDAQISDGRDLTGTTIAVNSLAGVTRVAAAAWIDQHGGDSTRVRFIEMPFSAMPEALAKKQVAAASGALMDDPTALSPVGTNRILGLPYDAVAKRFLSSAFVTTPKWLASNRETALRFANAILRSGRWANANPTISATIIAKYAKLGPQSLAVLAKTRVPYAERFDVEMLEPVITTAFRYHMIDAVFPATDLFDLGFTSLTQ